LTRFAAFLDACVLVPVALTDTLLRLAEAGLFRPLWSQDVLEEATEAVAEIWPNELNGMRRRVAAMRKHFPDAMVDGWQPLVRGIHLPDPGDRHVIAAAVLGRADCVITSNLKDFPRHALEPLGLETVSPDAFLLDQLDLAPSVTVRVVRAQAAATGQPPHLPLTPIDVLRAIELAGAPAFANEMRHYFP
jgi:predicted nucleic acid-binding protein